MLRQLFAAVFTAITAAAWAAPQLVWLNPHHDFGAFREEVGPVTCVFMAVNTGDEPVTVIDARANCGCTTPRYDRRPIAPGDTLRVSVAYNPDGRPGRFSKQVKVQTNATPSNVVLTIRGTVIGAANTLRSRYPEEIGPVRVSNIISPFGETLKGHVLAAAINIYNPTADTIRPAVGRKPGYINVLFRPEVIPPGEQGTMSMTAYTDRAEGWGLVEDSLQLIPDSRHPENMAEIATVMILKEDFSKLTPDELAKAPVAALSETVIDFGTIDPAGGPVTKSLTITDNGQNPLLIRSLSTPDKALSLKMSATKVKPGKSATVSVTVSPDRLETLPSGERVLNARITLITNAPASPTQIIRVVGTLKP